MMLPVRTQAHAHAHAPSQASELRKRRRTVSVTMALLLLLLALGNELHKAARTTSYYHYHTHQDRPRFSAMADLELHIHLNAPEAGMHHSAPKAKDVDGRGNGNWYALPAHTDEPPHALSHAFDVERMQLMIRNEDNPNEEARSSDASDSEPSPPHTLSNSERQQRNLHFAYKSTDEMNARADRFPSVQERVKLYMSNWYTPPCDLDDDDNNNNNNNDEDARVVFAFTSYNKTLDYLYLREIMLSEEQAEQRLFRINSLFYGSGRPGSFDQVHFMDRDAMMECEHRYCKDIVQFLLPSLDRVFPNQLTAPPILYQFGDDNRTKARRAPLSPVSSSSRDVFKKAKTDRYPNMPVFKKIRKSISRKELQQLTASADCYHRDERIIPNKYHLEPIVFKLKTQRHFGRIYDVADFDVAWELKRNVAIFRGELNGNYPVNYVASGAIRNDTVHQRCRLLERCWLVFQHVCKNSKLVDAKLTLPFTNDNSKQLPRSLNRRVTDDDNEGKESTVDLYDEKVSLEDMLQYKALIMLEGNDVSSGLKWALFSNSVVLMPEPTLISWAMEEWLEPWVHYIPINVYNDGLDSTVATAVTDVEQKMQWILDNDVKARQIALAGKLWIADLVLHPDVARDETAIFDEMVRRYATHFVRDKRVLNS